MSISTQISRLQANVTAALKSIENKGVTIPSGANSDDLYDLIKLIGGTPTPTIGTLDETSWADIATVSAAGTAESYWSVGDCKGVKLSGTVGTLSLNTTLYVYILGFDHNSDLEGKGISFGTFKTAATDGVDVCLVDSNYGSYPTSGTKGFNMNHYWDTNYYGSNFGGWKGCDLRYDILGSTDKAPSGYGTIKTTSNVGYDASATTATSPVANTLMAALPSELRAVMKPITKYSDNTGNKVNTASCVTTSVDYLPLLSEFEIFGSRSYSNSYEKNYQKQYTYYANGNSKVKYRHSSTSSTAYWWVRSAYYNTTSNFCFVNTNGYVSFGAARNSRGVAPAFVV